MPRYRRLNFNALGHQDPLVPVLYGNHTDEFAAKEKLLFDSPNLVNFRHRTALHITRHSAPPL